MEKGDIPHDKALELTFAGRLEQVGEHLKVPTSLFVSKVDVKMPALPSMEFYVEKDGQIELLKKADDPFSPLALSVYDYVLVDEKETNNLKDFAEKQLLAEGRSKALPTEQRVSALRRASILVTEDLFNDPTPENINKSKKIVGSFVYLLMKDPKAYMVLANLSSHDPYTLQHSVGTAINSIILGRKVGITTDQELIDLGMGGLLHDIGKVKVNREIINKNGPLNEEEWEQMREHSAIGYELVKDNPQNRRLYETCDPRAP